MCSSLGSYAVGLTHRPPLCGLFFFFLLHSLLLYFRPLLPLACCLRSSTFFLRERPRHVNICCACVSTYVCVCLRPGGVWGISARRPCYILAVHCSVCVSMATGAAAPSWALAWLCRASRPSVCPLVPLVRLPSRGSCQLFALLLPTGPARLGARKRVY